MFVVESLGFTEQEAVSDYDKEKIRQLQEYVVLRDTKFYVRLSWLTEKLSLVPSNHAAYLRNLDRVAQNVE